MCGIFVVIGSDASTLEATRNFGAQIKDKLTLRGKDLYTQKESALADGFTSIAHHSLLSIYGWDRDINIHRDSNSSARAASREFDQLYYNGEIYSINRIKSTACDYSSDQEFLLEYIRSIDTDSSRSLLRLHRDVDGQFAFLYHTESSILLGRDYHGQKPLFFYHSSKLLVASSSLSLLRNYLSYIFSGKDSELSIQEPQLYALPLSDEMSSSMPPGSLLFLNIQDKTLIVNKSLCMHHYYDMFDDLDVRPTAIRQRFTAAVSSILPYSKPFTLLLSGGYDSAALLSELVRLNRPPIACITYDNGRNSMDVDAAVKIARLFNLRHHIIKCSSEAHHRWNVAKDHFDLPTDPASEALYHLLSVASTYSRIVLCGDGGDEISRRYKRFLYYRYPLRNALLFKLNLINITSQPLDPSLPLHFSSFCNLFKQLFAQQSLDACHRICHKSNSPLYTYKLSHHIGKSHYDKPMTYELMVNLSERLLAKSDQISYSLGVELRTPFLCMPFSSCLIHHNRSKQRINASKLLVNKNILKLLSSRKIGLA